MRLPRRQVKNPRISAVCKVYKLGEVLYGYRLGSKNDGFKGVLVEHYCTLNNPYRKDGLFGDFKGYRNYAWVLEDPETGRRLSFQGVSKTPPKRSPLSGVYLKPPHRSH